MRYPVNIVAEAPPFIPPQYYFVAPDHQAPRMFDGLWCQIRGMLTLTELLSTNSLKTSHCFNCILILEPGSIGPKGRRRHSPDIESRTSRYLNFQPYDQGGTLHILINHHPPLHAHASTAPNPPPANRTLV